MKKKKGRNDAQLIQSIRNVDNFSLLLSHHSLSLFDKMINNSAINSSTRSKYRSKTKAKTRTRERETNKIHLRNLSCNAKNKPKERKRNESLV